jgi:hypothetical protein
MAQGDIHLHNYQVDLDTSPDATDDFVQGDDLVDDTSKSAGELREELNRVAVDEHEASGSPEEEDMREALEDGDEDLGGK